MKRNTLAGIAVVLTALIAVGVQAQNVENEKPTGHVQAYAVEHLNRPSSGDEVELLNKMPGRWLGVTEVQLTRSKALDFHNTLCCHLCRCVTAKEC